MAQTRAGFGKPRKHTLLIPLLTTLVLILSPVPECHAGPPLLTDDPGILSPGSWELIAAIAGEQRSGDGIAHSPLLDVSAGLTENTQLSLSLPYGLIQPGREQAESGQEFAGLGYKWRIISATNWEIALAANYEFPISQKTAQGPGNIRTLGLPVLFSYNRGDWNWHAQAALCIDSGGNHVWEYGLAVSHPLTASTRWMAEISGFSSEAFQEHALGFNLGLDYQLSSALHLLASGGSRLGAGPDPADQLEFAFYVGLQWFR